MCCPCVTTMLLWFELTQHTQLFDLQLFGFSEPLDPSWTLQKTATALRKWMYLVDKHSYSICFSCFGLCFEDLSAIIIKLKAIFSIWGFVCYLLAACFWCRMLNLLCTTRGCTSPHPILTTKKRSYWKQWHISVCVIQLLLNGLRSPSIFDYMWLTVATCKICWHLNMQSLALTVWINLTSHVTHSED